MRWILVGLLLIASSSTAAQGVLCGDRDEFLEKLENKYGEVIEVVAVTNRGAWVEWLVSPSGSWSMLVTNPNELTCIVASGEGWKNKTKVEGTAT